MSACMFNITDKNPNVVAGFGGCLCSDAKIVAQKGPFVVFYGTEMLQPKNPYPVLCFGCAGAFADKVAGANVPEAEVVGEPPAPTEVVPDPAAGIFSEAAQPKARRSAEATAILDGEPIIDDTDAF